LERKTTSRRAGLSAIAEFLVYLNHSRRSFLYCSVQ